MRVRTNFCWGDLGPCLQHSSAERSWMVDQLLTSATQMLSVSPTRWPLPAASLDDAWSVARGSSAGADKTKDRDRRRTVLGGFGDSSEAGLDLPSISPVAALTSSTPWPSPQPRAKPLAPAQRPP